jgi:DNA-3-methyladenine glycosylase I
MQRCGWVTADPQGRSFQTAAGMLFARHPIRYRDTRYITDPDLEGQQAGLSWITVLKKRQNYRQAFHQFDPVRVAAAPDRTGEKPGDSFAVFLTP